MTIGAHTRRHIALAKLTLAEARAEIEESVRRIERETGRACRHFSYPYGDEASAGAREFALVKEMGLKTAVTTRKGLIHAPARLRADGTAAASRSTATIRSRASEGAAERRAVRVLQPCRGQRAGRWRRTDAGSSAALAKRRMPSARRKAPKS